MDVNRLSKLIEIESNKGTAFQKKTFFVIGDIDIRGYTFGDLSIGCYLAFPLKTVSHNAMIVIEYIESIGRYDTEEDVAQKLAEFAIQYANRYSEIVATAINKS